MRRYVIDYGACGHEEFDEKADAEKRAENLIRNGNECVRLYETTLLQTWTPNSLEDAPINDPVNVAKRKRLFFRFGRVW